MEISCLLGVCSAFAQTAADAAASSASAASAAGDTAGAASGDWHEVLVLLGVVSVIVAQLRAGRVVRHYGRSLLGLMGVASRQALGDDGRDRAWDAAALLAGLESRRRAVILLLTVVVTVYSLAAALVLAYAELRAKSQIRELYIAVSFAMFAAFSAPVVLLGVSASNFNRLFWQWFGPATFAAVAMQSMVAAFKHGEPTTHVLWALGTVLGLSIVAVLVRDAVPAARWQQFGAQVRRHPVRAAFAVLAALLLALVAIGAAFETPFEAWMLYVLGGCTVGALAIVLCWFTLVDRIRRIVAPLLAAGYFAAVAGGGVVLYAVLPDGDDVAAGRFALAVAAGLVAGVLARRFMLSWIGLAYQQKVFSDAQFQVFCWMVSVSGVVVCVSTLVRTEGRLFDPMHLWLLAATVLALLVYWSAMRWLVKPLTSNKRLLVLRVFSRERRGERLLDELEYRWRFIGPIVLIGGPDVAERTIDPAKAANFLRGRLKHTFVPNRHALDKQVAAMDEAPDPDGRYRINEFFCFDDLWKDAVRQLLAHSDAVVVDLSEFSAERHGTAYELGLLHQLGALPRTVFLVSAQTDLAAVRAALGLGAHDGLPVEVIAVDGPVDGRVLVETLVRRIPAASAAAPAALPEPARAAA